MSLRPQFASHDVTISVITAQDPVVQDRVHQAKFGGLSELQMLHDPEGRLLRAIFGKLQLPETIEPVFEFQRVRYMRRVAILRREGKIIQAWSSATPAEEPAQILAAIEAD